MYPISIGTPQFYLGDPSRNQTLGIRDARGSVLDHIRLDTTVITVTERRIAATREVDGDNTIAPEDVRAKRGCAGRLIVAGLSDQVGLEEVDAGAREFKNFREIGGRQLFHLHQPFRGVLQHIDGAVVRGIVDCVAPAKRVHNSREPLFRLKERLHRTASERLNRGPNGADRQSRVAGARSRGQLDRHRGIDRRSAVRGVPNQVGERLPEAVRHFLRDVAQGVVNRGRE